MDTIQYFSPLQPRAMSNKCATYNPAAWSSETVERGIEITTR